MAGKHIIDRDILENIVTQKKNGIKKLVKCTPIKYTSNKGIFVDVDVYVVVVVVGMVHSGGGKQARTPLNVLSYTSILSY